MENIVFPLLIIVTIIAIAFASFMVIRWRATRKGLKSLTAMATDMINQRSGQPFQPPPVELSELGEALEGLKIRLSSLETDLGSEREKLDAIQATVAAGVIILDRDRQVTLLNKTAAQLFRAAMGTPAGWPFINLVRDHEMDSIVQRCLETNQNQTGLVQLASTKQYIELSAVPLSYGALILVQDLTNIRRLEKVRQDFISNISHELRSPLTLLMDPLTQPS